MKRKSLSFEKKTLVLERQNMKCLKCGRVITAQAKRLRDWKKELGHYPDKSVPSQAKFHHLKQVIDGGSNTLQNIVALCGRCHGLRHNSVKYKHE